MTCIYLSRGVGMRGKSVTSSVSWIVLGWCAVGAAQAQEAKPFQTVLQGGGGGAAPVVLAQLDEVTVYATRNPLPAFDYPGQVSVIDRGIIDDFNPSTVSDLFDAIPGAGFDGGPRRAGQTPNIRGLSGEGVLVLFDGARQSFLYGSGALGGVVAVRTITADDILRDGEQAAVRIGGGFQSVNNEWRAAGTGVWRSEDGRIDLVGSATFRTSDDIELGSGLALPADDQIVSSLVKGTFQVTEALTASASWIRFGGDSTDPNNPQGANLAGPDNAEVFRDIESNTFRASANYAPKSNNLVDLNVIGYYTDNQVDEDEVNSDRFITRGVETFGFLADNKSKFDLGPAALTLTYGGEYYRDEQVGTDNTTPDGTRGGVPDATAKFYGAFAQAELAWDRPLGAPGALTVIPGVRWDRFENDAPDAPSSDDEAVSPKVGVTYKPIEQLLLFGNWAEAFRAPSFNEIFADGVHFQIPDFSAFPPFPPQLATNFFIPNPDLQAEDSETWEVGAGVDFKNVVFKNDQITAKASYYNADVTNLIDLEVNIPAGCFGAPFPPCGDGPAFGNFSRNVNVTNAELTGYEAEAQYNSDYVYARMNYTAINGRNVDNGAFVGALQPNVFFVDAGVRLRAIDARLGARTTVAAEFDEVNDPTLARDSYITSDVYFVWEPAIPALDGLRVDLGADNIIDADSEVVAAGVSQPGRNLKVAMRWSRALN